MKTSRFVSLVLASLLLVGNVNAEEALQTLANTLFGQIPEVMPGSEQDTPARILLGKHLYFETALSVNNTQSCNSCHNIINGGAGVDNLPTSPGALGNFGTRNSPSTWNAGFQFVQFWDGRAKNLAEQARGPILNPVEMGLSSEQEAVERLQAKGYLSKFKEAFPRESIPLTFANIVEVMAAFQRTLITHDRFDEYLSGNVNALNKQEKNGLKVFISSGCNACHNGPLMGGELFMKMGLVNPYPNTEDKGRAGVTDNPAHNFLFKVPPLRNVAQTAPFFHDGAGITLEQAVLDTGWHQLGIKFNAQEVSDISAFLRALDNTKTIE